jgi:hypothetical protein
MDRNAYRDDNGADQPRNPADQPRNPADQPRNPADQLRTPADQPRNLADQREPYSDEYEPYPDQPDTYFRRRAATLAAGLGVLGLLAWAFSGGGGKPAPVPHDSPAAGALSSAAYPSGPASGSGSGSLSASLSASGSASPSAGADAAVPGLASQGTSGLPSASSSPAGQSAKSTASARAARAAANPEPGSRCSPNSVVLSLFSGSRSYPSGQNPQFGVNAVSTAPGTCTFDLSPAQLHLVVMSAGRVIWDSADCARGGGTQLGRLARGIPVQEYFTWNRAITLPGCVTLASSARPGSYQAQARGPAISSGTFSFKLVR